MKKIALLTFLTMSLVFTNCKKTTESTEPKEIEQVVVLDDHARNERRSFNLCDAFQNKQKTDLYGHSWSLTYWDDSTNTRLNIPGLFSPTLPNKLVWATDGSGVEYLYDGTLFNNGTFYVQNCGTQILINTLFLSNAVLTFDRLTYTGTSLSNLHLQKWEGTIPASSSVPLKVRVKAVRL